MKEHFALKYSKKKPTKSYRNNLFSKFLWKSTPTEENYSLG